MEKYIIRSGMFSDMISKIKPFSGCKRSGKIVKRTLSHFARGSMTVETAIVLPLFLIFFINLSSAVEMIRLHGNIAMALWDTGSKLSFYGALLTEPVKDMGRTGHQDIDIYGESENDGQLNEGTRNDTQNTEGTSGDIHDKEQQNETGKIILRELGDLVISYAYIRNRLVSYLGSDYLNNSPIAGGSDGLCMIESELIGDDDIIDIGVTYRVSPPIDFGKLLTFRMSNRYYAHLWNGYNVGGDKGTEKREKIVYITEDSEVYHTSTSCTYLKLAIRPSTMSALPGERNMSGGTYSRCLLCGWGDAPHTIYLCDEGGRYHYSRDCYSLKRNYKAVSLKSVQGTHRPCSRCGGFNDTVGTIKGFDRNSHDHSYGLCTIHAFSA